MRILVISDSHEDALSVREIIKEQPTAEIVIFCGDGVEDIKTIEPDFPNKSFHLVCGNSDYLSDLPKTGTLDIENAKVFYTHGHTYSVKATENDFIAAAKEAGANIALYGHTHKARIDYIDGMHIINPGSCQFYRFMGTYAVIDVTSMGILPTIIKKSK